MLKVSNLEVVYHSVLLTLKGVSVEVPEGKIVALLGANGAGKTTTMRAITGLLPIHEGKITKGTVTWQGKTLNRMYPDEIIRTGISQVFEGRRVFGDLTVEENLRAGGYLRTPGEVTADMRRFFARFPILGDRKNQPAGYLSGGEQQMLAIARALMAKPQVLLMDEPSLGLAPKLVTEVAELIKQINADGVTVLLVEQNAAMALELADYGYIMDNGKIAFDGTAAELLADKDIQEFYLGVGGEGERSFKDVKHYRRRKRWLS